MDEKISLNFFIETYKDSLGIEGANQMIGRTMQELGLDGKAELTREEAAQICRYLQEKSGFVGIVAGILLNRLGKEV